MVDDKETNPDYKIGRKKESKRDDTVDRYIGVDLQKEERARILVG